MENIHICCHIWCFLADFATSVWNTECWFLVENIHICCHIWCFLAHCATSVEKNGKIAKSARRHQIWQQICMFSTKNQHSVFHTDVAKSARKHQIWQQICMFSTYRKLWISLNSPGMLKKHGSVTIYALKCLSEWIPARHFRRFDPKHQFWHSKNY